MKKYTNYRIGLLSALLIFNTLSACMHTRKSLGFNITKQIIGGLAATSAIIAGMAEPALPPQAPCPSLPTGADKDIGIDCTATSAIIAGMAKPALPPRASCPSRPTKVDKDKDKDKDIGIDEDIIQFVLLLDQYARLQNDLHRIKQIQKSVDEIAKRQKEYGRDSTTTDHTTAVRLNRKSKIIGDKRA